MPFPIKMGLTIIVILVAVGAYFYQDSIGHRRHVVVGCVEFGQIHAAPERRAVRFHGHLRGMPWPSLRVTSGKTHMATAMKIPRNSTAYFGPT